MEDDELEEGPEGLRSDRFRRFASLTGAGLGMSSALLGRKLLSAVTFASKDKREAAFSQTLAREGKQLGGGAVPSSTHCRIATMRARARLP